MEIKHLQLFIVILCSFLSCNKLGDRELYASLERLEEKCAELERVINHYEQDHDSSKQKAVNFLIRNMQYHSTSTSSEVERYYELMDSISQLTPTRWSISTEQDSLFNSLESPFDKPLKKVFDNQIIKAEELISLIDYMFALYDSAVWCKGVDFETFCEYLLPYRVADECLDLDWTTFYREKVEERAYNALPFAKTLQDTLYTILNRMSTNYKFNIGKKTHNNAHNWYLNASKMGKNNIKLHYDCSK